MRLNNLIVLFFLIATPFAQDTSSTLQTSGFKDDSSAVIPPVKPQADTSAYQLPKMVVRCAPIVHKSLSELSSTKFTSYDIINSAGAAQDVSRYIGTLPEAVSGISEGYDNTFFVRGGRPSEVMFVVDGIEMENISHFSKADGSGGPIGFINSDFIDSVKFFAENIPVSYSPKISSVVDISMKTGGPDRVRQEAGIKNTGGMYSIQGPFNYGKNSYVLAGRYVDFSPLRKLFPDKGTPRLGDVFGKLSLLKTESLDISSTGVFSYNKYRYSYKYSEPTDNALQPEYFSTTKDENQYLFQGGAGLSLRLTIGKTVHEAHGALSFRNGTDSDSLEDFRSPFFTQKYATNPVVKEVDNRNKVTLSTTSTTVLSTQSSVSYGVHAQTGSYEFSSANQAQSSGTCVECIENKPVVVATSQKPTLKSLRLGDQEYGAFFSYELSYKRLRSSVGLRGDYFKLLGDLAVSPRLSTAVDFGRSGIISGGLGLFHQFPSDMVMATYLYLGRDIGFSSDSIKAIETRLFAQMQPLRCWQASLGYDKTFMGMIDAKCGLYYKWYDHEFPYGPPYPQNFFCINSGTISAAPQNSKRKSYGLEVSAKNTTTKHFFYSLSMSLFDSKDKYSNGSWYNDWINVRYTFSASGGFQFYNNHLLSASIQGTGGRPYSPVSIASDCIQRKSVYYNPFEPINVTRLDRLVSANLRYGYTTHFLSRKVESFIEILNLFNYLPTLDYKFDGQNLQPVKPFGITPIIGCKVQL